MVEDPARRSIREGFAGALQGSTRLVVHTSDAADIARLLAALLDDGHRVLVTGPGDQGWAPVLDALPAPLRGLCGQGPIPLSDLEQRELRTLLLTENPERRARIEQPLPAPDVLPESDRVADLCRAMRGDNAPAQDVLELLPQLLAELSPERFDTMVSTAQGCSTALRNLDAGGISSWARPLLERVLFGAERAELATLLLRAAEVAGAADALSGSAYRMAVVGPPDPDAAQRLRDYLSFLDSGGVARRVLPGAEQRAVIPVLHQLGLDRAALGDVEMLCGALGFLELVISMREVAAACRRLGVPEPKLTAASVARRRRELDRVEEAARAAEAFRREVLFIHPNSPIAVPDAATATMVSAAIVSAVDRREQAAVELEELADELAASTPGCAGVPEVAEVLAALRRGHLPNYRLALERLSAARLQEADQLRQDELLAQLRDGAPELADAWEEPGTHRYTQGTARFFPLTELLSELPAPDTADVVLLLEAQVLPQDALLVAVAAPQLVAISGAATPDPAEPTPTSDDESPGSTLATLIRAGVPEIAAKSPPSPPSTGRAPAPEPPPEAETGDPPPVTAPSLLVPAQRISSPEALPEVARERALEAG